MSGELQETIFKRWLQDHSGTVMKVARAYSATPEDCQDLIQEILLQAWCSIPQFRGEASEHTWVYRVALNTALAWHRREHRRRERQQPLFETADLPVPSANSAEQCQHQEIVERLYAAIHQLPKADVAIVLLYLDDLNYREIAEVLGLSESNVGVKLTRARKALGELMKEAIHEC